MTLVALPRLLRGYFADVILQVSWPGRGQTTQFLYALKLRATIIGYKPLLVMYGSLKPLLGKTYLLLTYPALFCLHLDLYFISDYSVHDSWPRVYVNRESLLFFESLWIRVRFRTVLVI